MSNAGRRASSPWVRCRAGGEARELSIENLVLAAGTLSSSRIVLESIYQERGVRVTLEGLMDNRQILVPFLNLRLIGRSFEPESYQYNQLAIGLEGDGLEQYVHCLVTTLKTALLHPIVQGVPFDLRTNLFLVQGDIVYVPPTWLGRVGYVLQTLLFPFQPLLGPAMVAVQATD